MRFNKLMFFWLAIAVAVPAHAADYDPFIGSYDGKYISEDADEKKNRDLHVEIVDVDDGFNVTWETTTHKKQEPKKKSYSIDFLETDRAHIYEAAQKKNLFGGRDPLDPMKGEPYAWARIEENKLTVFVLLVTDNGGYEMQRYDRILKDDNSLQVIFSRVRDSDNIRTIEATLSRQ